MSGQHSTETMTSNGKKFTVTREMLTAVARDQSRGGLMLSLESRLGKHYDSRETKFTIPLGTSH